MKRIWIVSELFYPEETSTAYILTKIAEALSRKFDVNVICGPTSYSQTSTLKKTESNIDIPRLKVYRVSETSLDKNKLTTRIIRFLTLSFKLSAKLYKSVQKGEPVLIVTNPAPILLIMPLIKRLKKFPLYILVHDVFPENTIPANIISSTKSLSYRILKYFFDSAYRKSDKLIVLGRDMQDVIQKKLGKNKNHTQVTIIENWAQTGIVFPQGKSLELLISSPKIDIQYAGNVGRVQGLQEFLEIFHAARNSDIRLSIWGEGAVKKDLEKYVKVNSVENVIFWRSYSREEQNIVLNNCDLAIVTLADGMYGLGVPSKSYNIMAAGKPILFIGDLNSEIAIMIKQYEIGYCFDPKEVNEILSFLVSLHETSRKDLIEKGIKARKVAEKYFSEDTILKKFINEIN